MDVLFQIWLPDENAFSMLFLFVGKSHVKTVFLGTLYFSAPDDLDFSDFISCSALNSSSIEVRFFVCRCCKLFAFFLRVKY